METVDADVGTHVAVHVWRVRCGKVGRQVEIHARNRSRRKDPISRRKKVNLRVFNGKRASKYIE